MSESSPETSEAQGAVAPEQKTETKATVPVAAVAKERAEKRAARAEADSLKQKLAEVQEQNQGIDMTTLIETLGPFIAELTEAAAQKAIAPLQAEAQKLKTAVSLGLNPAQADELARVKTQWPGMDDAKALVLAKMEKPDLFPAPQRSPINRSPVTGLPPGGDSMMRSGSDPADLMAKISASKDPAERQQLATQEFTRRINLARGRA